MNQLTRDAGKIQQIIDEFGHALGIGLNARKVARGSFVQHPFVAHQHHGTETADRTQWRAQVVRNRITERFEFFVDHLKVGCAAFDVGLKFRIQHSQLAFAAAQRLDHEFPLQLAFDTHADQFENGLRQLGLDERLARHRGNQADRLAFRAPQ